MAKTVERRLAAVLAADVVGYSRLMEADEVGTLAGLEAHRKELTDPKFAAHNGRVVKLMGDGVLVEFASVVDAIQCAVEIQRGMAERNSGLVQDKRIAFRIGVNVGEIIVREGDIYGDSVNISARLEQLADPGGICVSGDAYRQARGKLDVEFEDLGPQRVKNVSEPLAAYRVLMDPATTQPVSAPVAAPSLELPEKPSIAVLPFDNMSGDPEQEYFADGITDDIITDLSKVSSLFVIARNSSFVFKSRHTDIREVCSDLGVDHVLEGSVRKAGDRLRINAQLIEGATGRHLWAERYDRELTDIFALQDEVTREIVDALKVELTSDEMVRRGGRARVDPDAYDCLVRARTHMLDYSADSMNECRNWVKRALDLDPGLTALGSAYLAGVHLLEHVNGWNKSEPAHLDRALEFSERALAADENEATAQSIMATTQYALGNWDNAESSALRCLELDPNSASGYGILGEIRHGAGRNAEAIEYLEQALHLDPHYHLNRQRLGRAHFALGQYEEAEDTFRRRLHDHPDSDTTRAYLASIYGHTGRLDEARRVWSELMSINPDFSVRHLQQVLPYKDSAFFGRLLDGLNKAGLSDAAPDR